MRLEAGSIEKSFGVPLIELNTPINNLLNIIRRLCQYSHTGEWEVTKNSNSYKVFFRNRTKFTRIRAVRTIVAQILPNDKILWKEYKFSNLLPKYKTIRFDDQNPIEDALK